MTQALIVAVTLRHTVPCRECDNTMCSRWLFLLLALFVGVPQHTGGTDCGVPSSQSRIVGGETVDSVRYPWFVALVSTTTSSVLSVSCGGSLITSKHVLSAAHCFPTDSSVKPENMYRAVFQLLNRCTQTDPDSSAISKVDIYPSYNTKTLQGDIAIATLAKTVNYMPVCLPPKNVVPTGEATIIGFGSTLLRASSAYPCRLLQAKITIFTRKQCVNSGLASEYSSITGTVCAGKMAGGVDSCDGDSGGPLLTVGSNKAYTIQGIVSFGEGCARKNLPGVYTQVSAYRDFIDKITCSSSSSSSSTTVSSSSSSSTSTSSSSSSSTATTKPTRRPFPWSEFLNTGSSSSAGSSYSSSVGSSTSLAQLEALLQQLMDRNWNRRTNHRSRDITAT